MRKNFTFPILIWIDDQILRKIIRIAPDLENWGSVIDFENDTDDLVYFLQNTTEEIFNQDIIPTPQEYKEIESALQDLDKRGEKINPEIQAGLDLAFGLREYELDNLDDAISYYHKSRKFWKQENQLERYGILLVKTALAYSRKPEISRTKDDKYWPNATAKDYLEEALKIFRPTTRIDLFVETVNILGGVLRKLKAWEELENLAIKYLQIYASLSPRNRYHINLSQPLILKGVRGLGQIYGFLAEAALGNQDYQKANENAQQALEILVNIPDLPPQEFSLYRLLLARSQIGLQEIYPAIQTLEIAKRESHPQYDPQLYITLLKKLNTLYFQDKKYLTAFNIKQEQLQIEQQYGFRAFVGASYLNPQQEIIDSPDSEVKSIGKIPPEISASGRETDVQRLHNRIASDQHKLTVIHGQSGVGKSSILKAGLIPALQQETIVGRNVLPILLRVYTNWVESLGEYLKSNNVETLYTTSLHSTDAIIQQLRKNADGNLLTVVIFDQFEEFFFVYPEQKQRKQFYDFLRVCLDIPFVKIILSLREDYLHHLLELDRSVDLTVTNNNILDKDIRYYLGNFSPPDAQFIIKSLTDKTGFYLPAELIDAVVQDLAGDIGEVRPIELQIVGTQLQSEQITTLEKYQQFGKEKLVENFLEDVIKDCGSKNEQTARLILYLLTDENLTRPLITRTELAKQVTASKENIDLVLEIFVVSGLVLLIPESPADRYQLVHDYLVEFIRQQQGNELLEKLAQTEAALKEEQEAKKILADAQIEADAQIKKGQRRLKLSSGLAACFLLISGVVSVYSLSQFKEANIAKLGTNLEGELLQEFQGHLSEVISVSFSPDGKTIATASSDKTTRLWNLKGELLQEFQGHLSFVMSVNFSPDGKTIATASSDKTARLWNLKGEQIQELKGHIGSVRSVSFSPDGNTIATASGDNTVRLWNLKGEQIQELKPYRSSVRNGFVRNFFTSVNFSPDGKTIATASWDTTARLWNLQGKLIQDFKGHKGHLKDVSFSPDGKTIATASWDTTARLWNLEGKLLQEFKGHKNPVNSVSFSPDGKTIATASDDRTARLWNLKGELIRELKGHQGFVRSVSFSPDGRTIATASDDRTARLWRVRDLDRAIKDGCVWLKYYLQNPSVNLSEEERRLCDDI
ncbi:MAG: hypothetical protein F6K62_12260 [Sphaerospermopsis sp. SIO1G2]|nr:hypothetical protein [Sphaerospermopsis sp. SIO1G2]